MTGRSRKWSGVRPVVGVPGLEVSEYDPTSGIETIMRSDGLMIACGVQKREMLCRCKFFGLAKSNRREENEKSE